MSNNTQLSSANGFDTNCLIFSEPQAGSIPGSVPISYKRILIQRKNHDGTVGDVVLATPKVFSFGPSENKDISTGKPNGYVMPLCLYTRDNPQPEEKKWVKTFNEICEACKDHILKKKQEIGKFDLDRRDLRKLNPLYYKREKDGSIAEGTGPTLYSKLIVSKKLQKIVTMFFDFNGEIIDPLKILRKYCFVRAAVKIESIFIGMRISLQVKLYECEVKLMEAGMPRLLRPNAHKRVLTSTQSCPLTVKKSSGTTVKEDSDTDQSEGSINLEDSEEEKEKVLPKKKVIKRRVKTVLRKNVAK